MHIYIYIQYIYIYRERERDVFEIVRAYPLIEIVQSIWSSTGLWPGGSKWYRYRNTCVIHPADIERTEPKHTL